MNIEDKTEGGREEKRRKKRRQQSKASRITRPTEIRRIKQSKNE